MQRKSQNNDTRKQIRFGELLEKINKLRGTTPLGTWVKEACTQRIEKKKDDFANKI